MNQFKKAKQLRSESGQATESITDLTTAGVTQKPENARVSAPDEKAAPQNIKASSLTEKTFAQNTEAPITNEKKTPENIETSTPNENEKALPKTDETPIPKIFPQNTVDINVSAETATNEQKISLQLPTNTATNNTPISAEPSIVESTEEIVLGRPIIHAMPNPGSLPTYENIMPGSPLSMTQGTAGQEPISVAPQWNNNPTVQEIVPPNYTDPAVYKNNISQSPAMQTLHEPQPAQEMTAVPQNKNRKKSAPNIFAPKGEAKSMRKSLVLKPTSVKIAENYCEKNGGSFNELIQTLLDNFIDEYGL